MKNIFVAVLGLTLSLNLAPCAKASNQTEKVLHRFGATIKGQTDGIEPYSELTPSPDVKNVFLGTTQSGGAYGSGTVYSIDLLDKKKDYAVEYSFPQWNGQA